MNSEQVAKTVKAVAAVLAVAGVAVTPESQDVITGGFLAVYAIISALEGKFFKSK